MNEHFPLRPGHDDLRSTARGGFTLLELFVVLVGLLILVALLMPATRTAREPARRSQCKNNLKQIGLALHNYADVYGVFPPAFTVDAEGNRLHSWRTLILPFLDHSGLYDQIDFSKAWDDPANEEAFQQKVHAYSCPSAQSPQNQTTYMAIVTPRSCIQSTQSKEISEVADGLSNTILVIEVDAEHAVPWMSPQDADERLVCSAGPDSKLPHAGGMHVLFGDGMVRFLSAEFPAAKRRALITVDGGERVEID